MTHTSVLAKGRDGAATRARIEREALRLFAEKGFDATSIRDIAQSVGVADAALYRYFRSKEAIGHELFRQHYRILAGRIAEIAARPVAFIERARALVAMFCRLFDEEPDVFSFVLLSRHSHVRFVSADPQENAVEALCRLMADAHAKGEIVESNAELAAAKALGVVLEPATFVLYGRITRPLGSLVEELTMAAAMVVGAR
jgi:AcrR family transcriptional regulator